jgi:predicted O-methyltransferase YrrM
MSGLEFGSGRSTTWFAGRLGSLTSVEHDARWYAQVRAKLDRRQIANVDLKLIPLDHSESEPERADYNPAPAYVAVLDEFRDRSLDLVVVDGHYRTTCVKRSVPKLKPGGLLLVDDTEMWHEVGGPPVPKGWHLVDRSSNGIKQACIWQKPSSAP